VAPNIFLPKKSGRIKPCYTDHAKERKSTISEQIFLIFSQFNGGFSFFAGTAHRGSISGKSGNTQVGHFEIDDKTFSSAKRSS